MAYTHQERLQERLKPDLGETEAVSFRLNKTSSESSDSSMTHKKAHGHLVGSKFSKFGADPDTPGGFCMSSFVILRKSDSILVGKISDPRLWYDEFGLSKTRSESWADEWRLPASFLKFGEHPDTAARRVIEKQLALKDYSLAFEQTQSHTGESTVYKGKTHWDICFVYEGHSKTEPKPTAFFGELSYLRIDEIGLDDLGSEHGWVVNSLDNL